MKLLTTSLTLVCLASAFAGDASAPRAARSVHLSHPAPDGALFYNEAIVDVSANGSYFMVCGWNTGYFGIQQLGSEDKKVAIFSVWDQAKGDDPKAVPLEQRVEILFQGEGVNVSRFGGEGTGGKSMLPFAWRIGEPVRCMVGAKVEGEKTAYTGWIFLPDKKEWKKLVTFRTRSGSALRGYYSFVEDFRRDGRSVGEVRRARFGNGWVKATNGEWSPLTKARFTASSSKWEAKETINAGVDGGWFFLATGGETKRTAELRSLLECPARSAKQPGDLPTP
ncbi:MAG: DUF3472 domain-containing protein [Pedosphaera sp.]|nr:DUF3472 domain-containing protein [Pedosphaera sp.]